MATKPQTSVSGSPTSASSAGGSAGRRPPDVRDAVAELAERAQIISQEASGKVTAAMRDVVHAASGMAGFALESGRDLVQYLVRRGQMTQEEGDRLIREAEHAHAKRTGKRGSAGAKYAAAKTSTRETARPSKASAAKPAAKEPKTKAKKR